MKETLCFHFRKSIAELLQKYVRRNKFILLENEPDDK
jgi:hypothetical protein